MDISHKLVKLIYCVLRWLSANLLGHYEMILPMHPCPIIYQYLTLVRFRKPVTITLWRKPNLKFLVWNHVLNEIVSQGYMTYHKAAPRVIIPIQQSNIDLEKRTNYNIDLVTILWVTLVSFTPYHSHRHYCCTIDIHAISTSPRAWSILRNRYNFGNFPKM